MMALFDFEQDGRYPLRRIPMMMRFNLDACGIRISLTGWIMLSRDEREELVALPCKSNTEREVFCARLADMLAPHAGNPDTIIERVDIDPFPSWKNMDAIPQSLVDTLSELSLPNVTLPQWRVLTDLQRFALIKLTRSGHKNANLQPALKEFGLA
jgi:hypothetical protein